MVPFSLQGLSRLLPARLCLLQLSSSTTVSAAKSMSKRSQVLFWEKEGLVQPGYHSRLEQINLNSPPLRQSSAHNTPDMVKSFHQVGRGVQITRIDVRCNVCESPTAQIEYKRDKSVELILC